MQEAKVTAVHIHAPPVVDFRTLRRKCPTCGRRRTMFASLQEWYGWHVTCLACGESWQDGERCSRPFVPGWRRRNIAAAKLTRARLRRAS